MTDADSDGNRLSCVDSNGNVRNRRNGAVPRGASADVALMPLNAFSRPGRGIGELGGNPALTSVKVLSSAMTSSALAIIAFRVVLDMIGFGHSERPTRERARVPIRASLA